MLGREGGTRQDRRRDVEPLVGPRGDYLMAFRIAFATDANFVSLRFRVFQQNRPDFGRSRYLRSESGCEIKSQLLNLRRLNAVHTRRQALFPAGKRDLARPATQNPAWVSLRRGELDRVAHRDLPVLAGEWDDLQALCHRPSRHRPPACLCCSSAQPLAALEGLSGKERATRLLLLCGNPIRARAPVKKDR